MEAAQSGVELSEVAEEVLHGKFLLWDDDDVVITSLAGLAQTMRSQLEDSLQAAQAEKLAYLEQRKRRRRG